MTEGELWRLGARRRTERALAAARSPADRLALLRELVRLGDGYLPLATVGITLSSTERSLLQRFQIIEAGGGTALIFSAADSSPWSRELALDTASRRLYEPAVPDAVLLRLSPHATYQTETQKSAVRALVTMPPASTLIVSMPTGSGKSLLFEIAPKWWRSNGRPTSVAVIVPTIALALDHERTLSMFPGLEGSRAITSQLTVQKRAEALDAFRRGEVPILLLSPEMAMDGARSALLEVARPYDQKPAQLAGQLSAIFIDEAHIIESWGRTFRPEFQRIPALVDQLRGSNPDLRVVLLSATINSAARKELRRAYSSDAFLEVNAGAPRYEFDIVIEPTSSPQARDDLALDAVDQAPRPTILYTTLVDHARALYDELRGPRQYGRLALFTGEVESPSERQRIIDSWAKDELDLVVATSAFGMGIDKRDVRSVVHACLPESAARYYQEIGRGARDGHQGIAIATWFRSATSDKDDESLAVAQATRQWLTRDVAEDRWQAIVKHLSGQEGALWDEGSGKRVLSIALDAARDGIAREPNDYNRLWNMSLLNLMQRAGALTIRTTLETNHRPIWEALVERPELLGQGPAAVAVWDEIFRVRETEKSGALRELSSFRHLLAEADSQCLLQGLFELIEPESDIIEACGRCAACRSAEISPPTTLRFAGLERVWSVPPIWARPTPLPPGIVLFHADNSDWLQTLPVLLSKLAAVGVEQIVVPDGLGPACAKHLTTTAVQAGFVLEWRDIMRGAEPLDIPSAAVLPATSSLTNYVDFLRAWTECHPRQSLAVWAEAGLMVRDRPLEQILSKIAPYDERHLNMIANRDLPQ